MTLLGVVLLVFFVIVAILLILLVLVQNEEGDSLGGIFAGGSNTAFGSRSGNVLTRATTVLGTLFLVISLGMALLSRNPSGSGVESMGRQLTPDTDGTWWQEDETSSTTPDYFPETFNIQDFSLDFDIADDVQEPAVPVQSELTENTAPDLTNESIE